jgi:diguanylate cyclase (GGDEF)-like protein/PAS domain S-box-containing protein
MTKGDHFYRDLLDTLYDGVYFVDRDRRITYWNKGAERISGYESSAVVGMRCADNLLVHINEEGVGLCKTACPLAQTLNDGQVREAEVYLKHKDGHRVPVLIRVSPLQDSSGNIVGAVESFRDNSSEAALLEKVEDLQKMALLDPLTELANRRYIDMTLSSRLDEMNRYGWPCAVLFIDIDNFKIINDKYGHSAGDQVLKMVARTLASNLRSFDILGRYGGEEFIAIIANVNEEQLYSFANRLRVLVEQSSQSAGTGRVSTTISIGATLAQTNDTVETVVRRADQLMYHSKSTGRNRISTDAEIRGKDDPILGSVWSVKNRASHDSVASAMGKEPLKKIVPARQLDWQKVITKRPLKGINKKTSHT